MNRRPSHPRLQARRAHKRHIGHWINGAHPFGRDERREGVWRSHVMKQLPTVRLELDSRPESVTLVRAMLSALGESLGLEAELLNDVKTAVSEACNNVVVHAYGGLFGPLRVGVEVAEKGLAAAVQDDGIGMPDVAGRAEGMGVGLAVMTALAARAEFLTPADGGTEVQMWFPFQPPELRVEPQSPAPSLAGARAEPERSDRATAVTTLAHALPPKVSGEVVVTVSPVSLTSPVLGRLARALAAGARFSFDRFSDVYLVADTLGAHAQRAATGDALSFSLDSEGKRLELALGPFADGSGAQFQAGTASKARDSPLALLADEITVDRAGTAETLRVVLRDRGGGVSSNLV